MKTSKKENKQDENKSADKKVEENAKKVNENSKSDKTLNSKSSKDSNSSERTYKMFELQMMQGQMEKMQEERQKIESKSHEIFATVQSLKGIEKSESSDVMVPVGSGVFVKGQVKDNKNAIYAVGSGIAAKNTIENTLKFLEQQSKLAEEAKEHIEKQMKEMATKAQGIISELEKGEHNEGSSL